MKDNNDFFDEFKKDFGEHKKKENLGKKNEFSENLKNRTSNSKTLNIGLIFKEAREKKGLSLDDVSSALCIASKYLEYIEKNEFDKFYAEIYLLGFMRKFASYLDLDPEEILKLYNNSKDALLHPEEHNSIYVSGSVKKVRVLSFFFKVMILAIFILFGIVGFYIWKNLILKKEAPAPVDDAEVKINESVDGVFLPKDSIEIKDSQGNAYDFKLNYILKNALEFTFEDKKHLILEGLEREVSAKNKKILLFDLNKIIAKEGINNAQIKINFKEDVLPDLGDKLSKKLVLENSENIQSIVLEVILQANTYFKYLKDDKAPVEKFYNHYTRFFIEADRKLRLTTNRPSTTTVFYKKQKILFKKDFVSTMEFVRETKNDSSLVYSRDII